MPEPNGLLVGYLESPAESCTLKDDLDRNAAASVLEFFLRHCFHLQIQEDSILNLLESSPDRVREHEIQAVQMAAQQPVDAARFRNGAPTHEAITSDCRIPASSAHPDKGGSMAAMGELNQARYDALKEVS